MATKCHIYFGEFEEDNYKVRDHCHCTGLYQGPAHKICNLRYSGALWQGSSTENWAKSLKLSRMTAGYFIDTKFGVVTHTVNSNLKPLLFFKIVTLLSIPGIKTIQIWPPNFGSKRQSEGYLQNLQKMALTAWDKVYFSNPTGSFENRYLLLIRGVIYHLLFTVVKINDPPEE